MKNTELMKQQHEFTKTAFGIRAKIFSIIPLLIAIILFVMASTTPEGKGEIEAIYYIGCSLAAIGECITQLQYGRMVNEYIKSKK